MYQLEAQSEVVVVCLQRLEVCFDRLECLSRLGCVLRDFSVFYEVKCVSKDLIGVSRCLSVPGKV